MLDLRDLYQEVILEHSRNPRNLGTLDYATSCSHGHNPLCGDKITVHIQLEDSQIKAVGIEGSGCAISMAAGSLMSEAIKGRTVGEINELFEEFHTVVTDKSAEVSREKLGKLSVLTGVREFPMRVKCATLAWHTLKAAMDNQEKLMSTE